MIDIDGKETFSPVQTISISCFEVNIYPNPSANDPNLVINTKESGTYAIKIINGVGQCVYATELEVNGFENVKLPLSRFSDGVYSVLITNDYATKVIRHQKLVN